MNLSCRKVFPLVIALTIACHDSTAPLRLPAQFLLENINGQGLPTLVSISPGTTILSASLTLDYAGKAFLEEHFQDSGGIERTFSSILDYDIDGDDFEITGLLQPCPANANCALTTYRGTISSQTLSLVVVAVSIDGSITFNFRTAPTL